MAEIVALKVTLPLLPLLVRMLPAATASPAPAAVSASPCVSSNQASESSGDDALNHPTRVAHAPSVRSAKASARRASRAAAVARGTYTHGTRSGTT
eukprot:6206415-Pleurochrysis_carterae.AAC.1